MPTIFFTMSPSGERERDHWEEQSKRFDNYFNNRKRASRKIHGAVFVSRRGVLFHVAPIEHQKGPHRYLALCGDLVDATCGTRFEQSAVEQIICERCLEEYRAERSTLREVIAREQQTINV